MVGVFYYTNISFKRKTFESHWFVQLDEKWRSFFWRRNFFGGYCSPQYLAYKVYIYYNTLNK
jgi:hypothetical protein